MSLFYLKLYEPFLFLSILFYRICDILGGKGAAKGGRFQAKVTTLKNRDKAVQLLADHFEDVQK